MEQGQASGAAAHRYARHRTLTIKKIENGYIVTARFYDLGEQEQWNRASERQFVCNGMLDVTDFVAKYLDAPGEDLTAKWEGPVL